MAAYGTGPGSTFQLFGSEPSDHMAPAYVVCLHACVVKTN